MKKYQIQYRNRRYKDRPQHPWQNPWHSYGEETQTLFGPTTVVVQSDDLAELRVSMAYMHNNSSGMVDHRLIQVIDEQTAVFPPC